MSSIALQASAARRFYFDFLKKNWLMTSIGVISVLIANIAQIYSTRLIGWIVDFFNQTEIPTHLVSSAGDREQTLFRIFLFLVGSRVLLAFARKGWRATLGRQSHYAGAALKTKLWEHVRFFPKRALDQKFTKGVLMNANTSDVNSARMTLGFTLVTVADVVFLGIFSVVSMLMINVQLTLVSLISLLLVPLFIRLLSEREIRNYSNSQNALGELNDLASQAVSTARLQRMTQTGDFWFLRLMKGADNYRQQRLRAVNTSLLFIPLMGLSSVLGLVIIFFYGTHLYFAGLLGLGDFLAMQGLAILLQMPLFELGFVVSDWRKGRTSLRRLGEIFVADREEFLFNGGEDVSLSNDVLEAKNLSFGYSENSRKLFQDFNLSLRKGERLGITGPIGSGKTTLVQLLAGLETPDSGEVHLYKKKVADYDHEALRKLVGVVQQKPFLFADTIKANIGVHRELSDEEVWHYLRLASLEKDVRSFTKGLDTALGEWGINLSGGQKQRLTLARSLALQPEVLFLDDCLSAVDTVTEEEIMQNLHRELSGTTLIWVAHRKSTLKYCDRILDLGENGPLNTESKREPNSESALQNEPGDEDDRGPMDV